MAGKSLYPKSRYKHFRSDTGFVDMTNKEFWNKLDMAVDGFEANGSDISMKSMEIVNLIKKAYDERLNIIIACTYEPGDDSTAHHLYTEVGNIGRIYLFYSSKRKARELSGSDGYGEASVRAIFNNIFCRREAMGIAFNAVQGNCMIMKRYLDLGFAGEDIEKPESFIESRKGGWRPGR